ncbi:hypothetical protein H6798_04005 [Candidatus Nomurabacteria bacterium]|nr:hypothetical protein [Candidatus Nomurabacteria bacterium]
MEVPKTVTSRRWDSATRSEVSLELPFEYDQISLDNVVEALVVGTDQAGNSRYVITKVVEGKNDVCDDFFADYNSAKVEYGWFYDFPEDYRLLCMQAENGFSLFRKLDEYTTDILPASVGEFALGDKLLISHYTAWGQSPDHSGRIGLLVTDAIILEQFDEVGAEIERLAARKQRLAKQLVRTIEHRERLKLRSLTRIEADVPSRVFEHSQSDGDNITIRYVFGNGPVQDHFVDMTASARDFLKQDILGTLRYSQDGGTYVTPHFLPFGMGTKEDPLMAIALHVHTDTVLNPAVGEQTVSLLIDGVTYSGCVDPEMSSHYFENPGHDIYFFGFKQQGRDLDTFRMSKEQAHAYHQQREFRHKVVMGGLYAALRQGRGVFDDPQEMEALEREIGQELDSMPIDEITKSLHAMRPDYSVSGGACILVPRSMLDSIEVVFHRIQATGKDTE